MKQTIEILANTWLNTNRMLKAYIAFQLSARYPQLLLFKTHLSLGL